MAPACCRLGFGLCLFALGCEASSVAFGASPAPELTVDGNNRSNHGRLLARTRAAEPLLELDLPTPSGTARERCPDEVLPRAWEADASLRVRVRDARRNPREILPLDLKLALDTDSSFGSESSASPRRRYLAELVIEDYAGPRLFRRLNAPRSEWAAGKLSARLVIHDRQAARVLCQAPVQVRGDARSASIRRLLRESTRRTLEKKLHERTWSELSVALGQVSSMLRIEPKAPRDLDVSRGGR